jgi:V-type H+-transporting ATPase subunit E
MSSSDSAKISQMANFIQQEAQEKASELKIKAAHDASLEKSSLVHKGKMAVMDEFVAKEKQREVDGRIAASVAVKNASHLKMSHRDALLQHLLKDASHNVSLMASNKSYEALMLKLLVQALIKIEEDDVVVYCRAADTALVSRIIPQAVTDLKKIIKDAAGVDIKPNVTLNPDRSKDLSNDTYGGVVCTADTGRVVLNNTLEQRLDLIYKELLPAIREKLFPMGQQ